MEKTVTVKWIRSAIGRTGGQKKTIRGLGFKRLHQTLTLPDRPETRGMIHRVIHLVEVNPSTPRPENRGLQGPAAAERVKGSSYKGSGDEIK
jgi:large subunit ribosomal protein L30